MRVEESITLDRSPQEVFDYLEDRSHDGTWMSSVERLGVARARYGAGDWESEDGSS